MSIAPFGVRDNSFQAAIMPTALVTGITGFIGRALCSRFTERGWDVVGLARNTPTGGVPIGTSNFIACDLAMDLDLKGRLPRVDVVVHLAARAHMVRDKEADSLAVFRATNRDGTLRLARAAAAIGIPRFVFVSSIGVNGNATRGAPFREVDLPAPHDAYALSKLEAEEGLNKLHDEGVIEIVIVRPPLVYGPANPGNFLRLMRLVSSGVPLPLGAAENRRSMIFVGNLVDALIACAEHPSAAGRCYLVSDGEDLSLRDLLQQLATALGRKPRLWHVPPQLLRSIARLAGRAKDADRLLLPLIVDSSMIRREIGWTPSFTLAQGLYKTVEWFKDHRG